MTNDRVDVPPEGDDEPIVSTWDLVKWLVPSLAALCVLIGYVAKFAHHALLGFDPGLLEPNEYIAATGDFIRWLLNLPFSGLASWKHALLEIPHLLTVWPALLLGVGIPIWRRRNHAREEADPKRRSQARAWTAAGLLLVLLLRLLAMDAPVAHLEGALIASEVWKSAEQPGKFVRQHEEIDRRLMDDFETSSGVRRAIAMRAFTLWQAKMCMRAGPPPERANEGKPACTEADYMDRESGEGLAQLLVNCMLLILAFRVLRDRPSVGRAALACVAILSCLTMAATFGKLGHSMEYEFALIGLKTPLGATSAGRTETNSKQGVVLHSNKSWTTVAIDETVGCDTAVKIWRIANGEILWERDIYRTNVLTWRAAKVHTDSSACPPQSRFGNLGKVQQ